MACSKVLLTKPTTTLFRHMIFSIPCRSFHKIIVQPYEFPSKVKWKYMRMTSLSSSTVFRHDKQRKIITVPNILTVSRILVSPFIAQLVLSEDFYMALGLTAVAGLTDALDGLIARKFKSQQSWLGSVIDPLADKVLVTSLAISMTYMDLMPSGLMLLFVGRDICILSGALWLIYMSTPKPKRSLKYMVFGKTPSLEMNASKMSKINTFCQLCCILLSLVAPSMGFGDSPYLNIVWTVAGITTLTSGVDYLLRIPDWRRKALELSRRR